MQLQITMQYMALLLKTDFYCHNNYFQIKTDIRPKSWHMTELIIWACSLSCPNTLETWGIRWLSLHNHLLRQSLPPYLPGVARISGGEANCSVPSYVPFLSPTGGCSCNSIIMRGSPIWNIYCIHLCFLRWPRTAIFLQPLRPLAPLAYGHINLDPISSTFCVQTLN